MRCLHCLRIPRYESETGLLQGCIAQFVGDLQYLEHVVQRDVSLQPAYAQVQQVWHLILVCRLHKTPQYLWCILHLSNARRDVRCVQKVQEQRNRERVEVVNHNAPRCLFRHVCLQHHPKNWRSCFENRLMGCVLLSFGDKHDVPVRLEPHVAQVRPQLHDVVGRRLGPDLRNRQALRAALGADLERNLQVHRAVLQYLRVFDLLCIAEVRPPIQRRLVAELSVHE
mmetsp:Transcript_14112/g.42051  ORF Transcript_14112/g.42051 Transcript_14112/m.42051 type:complete len:226 (+) Transcript_14112:308-985(+)